jgi:hypothetical protein
MSEKRHEFNESHERMKLTPQKHPEDYRFGFSNPTATMGPKNDSLYWPENTDKKQVTDPFEFKTPFPH